MRAISGVHAAVVTPNSEQGHTPDFSAALELIDFLCAAGVQGIAIFGTTGEFAAFSNEHRMRLVHLAVKRSRVPILAGVSHATLDGALELAREACTAGAAGLVIMPPFFFRYSQPDVREFFLQFASQMAGSASLYLYNIPAVTTELARDTAIGLLATGPLAAINDSSGDFEYFLRLRQLVSPQPFAVLVGNDAVFARARAAGADGVICGVASAAPELMLGLNRAIEQSATETIQALEHELQELLAWLGRFPGPLAIKAAVAARGLKTGPLRTPCACETLCELEAFAEWFRGWLPHVQK